MRTKIPAEYRKTLGRVSVEKTMPQLRKFVEAGGTIVTIGGSTELAQFFGLPIRNGLVERTRTARSARCRARNSMCPARCSRRVSTTPIRSRTECRRSADVFFENSPAFRLGPEAELKGIKPIAWFPSATPLRSGWAWGQSYLEGTVAAAEAPMGEGKLFLLGVEAAFRGQPHGTYKLLFNSIYAGPAKETTLAP